MTFGEFIGGFFFHVGGAILILIGIAVLIKLIEVWMTFGHKND